MEVNQEYELEMQKDLDQFETEQQMRNDIGSRPKYSASVKEDR